MTPEAITSTMTLDRKSRRNRNATGASSPAPSPRANSYPPVLGYLATLGRSSRPRPSAPEAVDPQVSSPAKLKTPISILKSAVSTSRSLLFRSRSKDSILPEAGSELDPENMWQHKSSVPVYVGWRPPMPLPKDCSSGIPDRLQRRRSNLNRKKFASESNLLLDRQDSDCSGYMAIDPVAERILPLLPSLPPTLPLLSPLHCRKGPPTPPKPTNQPDLIRVPYAPLPPADLPVLPAECGCHSNPLQGTSLRVQFCLGQHHPARKTSASASFIDYSLRLKQRLQLPEGGSNLDEISETTGNRCGPWYDLWPVDPGDRICEIAQL